MSNDELWNLKLRFLSLILDGRTIEAVKLFFDNYKDADSQFIEMFIQSVPLAEVKKDSNLQELLKEGLKGVHEKWISDGLSWSSVVRLSTMLNLLKVS